MANVLPDLDGTLTERGYELWYEANKEVIRVHGGREISFDEFSKIAFGTDINTLLDTAGIERGKAAVIDRERNDAYDVELAVKSRWKPGAQKLLESFRRRDENIIPVTHLRMRNIQAIQTCLNFDDYFADYVTKDDLYEGEKLRKKPDPFGFSFAAQKLGVSPLSCKGIGDLATDMLGMRRAGMPKRVLLRNEHAGEDAREHSTDQVNNLFEAVERMARP